MARSSVAPCRLDVFPSCIEESTLRSDDLADVADLSARPPSQPNYVVLSTYPPTPCGIATFSKALCDGLAAEGVDVGVVRLGVEEVGADPRVVFELDGGDRRSAADAVAAMNEADVVIVQHEYGLFAGPSGHSVVELLAGIDPPTVVVAHTVLQDPTPEQRAVLEAVVDAADAVVVMTEAGAERLCAGFDVDPAKVSVIPHGAAVSPPPLGGRPVTEHRRLLTWGLLGPGKGIEWAIDAVAMLGDLAPEVQYRIAGDTHPKVVAAHGEAYREMLRARADAAGLGARVQFDAGYRGVAALGAMIREASVVVLPYDSPDQVTSGVLVDAVAAGRPVIATAFPHAVELLASGAGIVVPRRDPGALAAAVRRAFTEAGLLDSMAAEARRIGPALAWPAVAAQYAALGSRLLAQREAVPA